MRAAIAIALLLSACGERTGEPRGADPQSLDTFAPVGSQNSYCTFFDADSTPNHSNPAEYELVFITLFDDPQRRARISFGGEMMMLFPVGEGAAFAPEGTESVYSVEGYPDYDVRVTHMETGQGFEHTEYEGVVQFRRYEDRQPAVVAERAYKGSCGV